MSKKNYIFVGLILFFIAIIISLSLPSRHWIDLSLSNWIISHRNTFLDSSFKVISGLASMWVISSLLAFYLLYLFFLKQQTKSAFIIGTGYVLTLVIAYSLKIYLAFDRPDSSFWLVSAKSFSFPSGHATRASFIFIILAASLPKYSHVSKVIAVLLIFACAYARIYLGVHYLFDVLVGILIGALLAVPTVRLSRSI
jgi:undecaprenyl-diphosphatase